jgi:hypothetical protein
MVALETEVREVLAKETKWDRKEYGISVKN